MKLCKVTDENGQTMHGTQWGEGVTHSLPPCKNPKLCSGDVLHAYESLEQALLLHPAHVQSFAIQVWEAEGDVVVRDSTKCGTLQLTTTKLAELPEWWENKEMREKVTVVFAILCAAAVLPLFEKAYPEDSRPRVAIEAALDIVVETVDAAVADTASYAAAYAFAGHAAYAADAAASATAAANAYADAAAAADAAAYAAYAAAAADAAAAAVAAADAAAADDAYADDAYADDAADKRLDIVSLVKEAFDVAAVLITEET